MNVFLRNIFFFIFFIFIVKSNAQGGDLLIQQYRRGPDLNANYPKLSVFLGPQSSRINTDLGTTSPTLTFGGELNVEFRVSKSVGLISGLGYSPVAYKYLSDETSSKDQLIYLTLPLMIRLKPTERVSINMGGIYSIYQSGTQTLDFNSKPEKISFEKGIFKNSVGGIVQIGYHFLDRFYSYVNYRWVKRFSPATQSQTNNLAGFQMGLSIVLWESKK